MKITHICLCGPVTDKWSYQDNLLPKYHKRIGYDVSVIASKFIWNSNGEIDMDSRSVYLNEFGIKTIRIASKFRTTVQSKFKKYRGLYEKIEKEAPDILFIHGIQFLDIVSVIKYLKKNPNVQAFVDNHADFSNSATNWISKYFLHMFVWRRLGKLIEPYVLKFYGVLPARVDFLINVYKISKEKVELLVMGADDDKVKEAFEGSYKSEIRKKYKIKESDFLIVSGGKIDSAKKQTILLMESIHRLNNKNVKLIVFGSVSSELEEKVKELSDGEYVQFVDWIDPEDSYKYFCSADLVVFPGRHSVFWEQVVGLGLPIVVKYWEGTTHIDVGGNCKLLYEDSVDEIQNIINNIILNDDVYESMLNVAKSKGINEFLYSKIASKSLNL